MLTCINPEITKRKSSFKNINTEERLRDDNIKNSRIQIYKKLQPVKQQKYSFKRSLKHHKGNDVLLKKKIT